MRLEPPFFRIAIAPRTNASTLHDSCPAGRGPAYCPSAEASRVSTNCGKARQEDLFGRAAFFFLDDSAR
jgi:hypothetical protein